MAFSNEIQNRLKLCLSQLSFRTGIIMIIVCVVCYVISFAQFLLPISISAKGVLWVIFFGLAKTLQYAAIAVLGAEGIKRFKLWWKSHKHK